jgi:hypothetical protein
MSSGQLSPAPAGLIIASTYHKSIGRINRYSYRFILLQSSEKLNKICKIFNTLCIAEAVWPLSGRLGRLADFHYQVAHNSQAGDSSRRFDG